jgi:phosphate transport system substrate-binding protein
MKRIASVVCACILISGCGGKEPGSTQLTKGALRVGVDDVLAPVMAAQASEFSSQYAGSTITFRPGSARGVVADFAADSVRIIALARRLNDDERKALAAGRVTFEEYEVARTAVAVVANRKNAVTKLRVGELDTIFAGGETRWPDRSMIHLAVSDVNSSVTEVFRSAVLTTGGGYDPSARVFPGGKELIDYVAATPGAIGIVGVNWLAGNSDRIAVVSVASAAMRPDSTYAPREYYSPAQAYVFLGYYAIGAPVYMYSREVNRDLGLGFIAFVSSAAGQKVFQNSGLVPVTMPVRLVQLTSQQVH